MSETIARTVHLTTAEAAEHLRVAEGTLRNWSSARVGPRSYKVSGKRLYRLADLDLWVESGGQLAGVA